MTDTISHVFNPVAKIAIRVLFLAILNGSLRAVLPSSLTPTTTHILWPRRTIDTAAESIGPLGSPGSRNVKIACKGKLVP